MPDSAQLLGANGPFVTAFESFRLRVQQQQMAAEIELLIAGNNGVLVAESPTGTGKTLAYLVPVVTAGKTTIISTATRHLQDQIFYKDIPQVFHTLGIYKKVCLLKGRSNYLCLHRMHTHGAIGAAQNNRHQDSYDAICKWSHTTKTGDINDIESLQENSQMRPLITSTTDNCLGAECSHFEDCFVRKARKNAMEADIVVVNHHLYLANLVLKQDGFGLLLPQAKVLIFDEAHSLPEIASIGLSRFLSSRQLAQLIGDLNAKLTTLANPVDDLYAIVQHLDAQLMTVVRLFSRAKKLDASVLFKDKDVYSDFELLLTQLEEMTLMLKARAANKEFDSFYQRAEGFTLILGECLFQEHDKDKNFCWVEINNGGFRLNLTPLELNELGSRFTNSKGPTTALVSATLSSAGDFSYFCNHLGLVDINTSYWPSPFDFDKQCRLFLPNDLPEPRDPSFFNVLLDHAVNLIQLCKGRTFFLFTSHQAMDKAYPLLYDRINYPILKQGQLPKHELIDRFASLGNAVLLGTSSFWEGVDVKGSSLSCVIIDKLPFASPDDPVLRARLKLIEQNHRNPFMHYQLPQMIISLKQGIGRLIRDENDYGIIMIGDSRLTSKAYGTKVLAALPAIPKTANWNEIELFAKQHLK